MIRMDDIRKFTNDSLQMDYFTWYLEQCSTLDAEIFNNPELRAEQKPFSKINTRLVRKAPVQQAPAQ